MMVVAEAVHEDALAGFGGLMIGADRRKGNDGKQDNDTLHRALLARTELGLRQSNCGRRLFKEPRHSAISAPCTRLTPVSARAYNRSVPFARNRATANPLV